MVIAGQSEATEAVEAWKEAARPGLAFERNRRTNAGLLGLVLLLWREQIEKDAPSLCTSESRWRVRKQRAHAQQQQRRGSRKRKMLSDVAQDFTPPASSKFAAAMNSRNEWDRIREGYNWSPWTSDRSSRGSDEPGEDDTTPHPIGLLRAWQLRSRCLQVATYYRVTGAPERAAKQKRLQAARHRFQRWAASVRQQRRGEAAARESGNAAETERERRGDRASARTRMAPKPKDVYRSGVRPYKPRAPPPVINSRRLGNLHRTQITSAAEIGQRLHENFSIIALRCLDERRGDG